MSRKINNLTYDEAQNQILTLWKNLVKIIGENSKKFSQFQYPWFFNEKKIWIIGNEPYGWGTPLNDYLSVCKDDQLVNVIRKYMDPENIEGYIKDSSNPFFLYLQSVMDETGLSIDDIGYWNYYPVGKRNASGEPDRELDDALFYKLKPNWKEVFWNVIRASNAKLVIFTGHYAINWHKDSNLLDKVLTTYGTGTNFKGFKVMVINHPNAQKNSAIKKEQHRLSIDYIKKNIR